ncbi:MAG: hypothetical protein C0593_01390 [Marinilabiliales bacterium]|nr:MAG: hypothetical protein C0593_01390 [Marinilabiliales bacterium]
MKSQPGIAFIEYENGKHSQPLPTQEAFIRLKNNEKIFLSPGRVEISKPLKLTNLRNVHIIGRCTSIVAKIDMPVIVINHIDILNISGLYLVHEVGEWCAQNCLELYDVKNLEIKNCTFNGSGYFGLALSNTRDAIIKSNRFFNCEYGLAAWGSSGLIARKNSFSKNRTQDIFAEPKEQFVNDIYKENSFE